MALDVKTRRMESQIPRVKSFKICQHFGAAFRTLASRNGLRFAPVRLEKQKDEKPPEKKGVQKVLSRIVIAYFKQIYCIPPGGSMIIFITVHIWPGGKRKDKPTGGRMK
jgi:hypothetical protein